MGIPIRTARTPWLFRMILRTGKFCVEEEGQSTEGAKARKMWLLKTGRRKAWITLRREMLKSDLSSFTSSASSGSR